MIIRKLLIILSLTLALTSCDGLLSGLMPDDGGGTEGTGLEAFDSHDDKISTPLTNSTFFKTVYGNRPRFSDEDWNDGIPYIELSELDEKGRVGIAQGLFDATTFPDEERETLDTNPTGWVQNEYDWVENKYIYNRCHLLGFQFSGLQDEPRNLMTGTRSFNIEGMLGYENRIADHLKDEDGTQGEMHQMLVRVTPDFWGDNALAHGIIYEADCNLCDEYDFAVYMYNLEPGVTIDYRTGDNWANDGEAPLDPSTLPGAVEYVYSVNADKFHLPECRYAQSIQQAYRVEITAPRDYMTGHLGLKPCGTCNP